MYLCLNCNNVYDNNFQPYRTSHIDIDNKNKIWLYCPKVGCNGSIIELDDNMVEIIKILNNKGYETKYCCGGHANEKNPHIYIMFDIEQINIRDLNIPDGFAPDYGMNVIEYFADGDDVITNQILLNKSHSTLCEWVNELE